MQVLLDNSMIDYLKTVTAEIYERKCLANVFKRVSRVNMLGRGHNGASTTILFSNNCIASAYSL